MTAPTPPDRPTLTLKTATPASEDGAPTNRSTPRNQPATNKRPINAPRANTLRLDGSAPTSNEPRQPTRPVGTPAKPFSQTRAPAGRSTPQSRSGSNNRQAGDSWGKPPRQDGAARGGDKRFDAPAQTSGEYRPARGPAGRNTPQNQPGSYNRQDNRQSGDAWGKPARQDSAPRGGDRRFDAPAQRNGDYKQERAPAGRNTPHNQTGSYGSFNRQDSTPRGGDRRFDAPAQRNSDYRQERAPTIRNTPHNQSGSYGSFNRQDSTPRGGDRRLDAPAQRNSDYRQERAPAGRNTQHNQSGSYGSYNRQDNRQSGDAWGNPQRQDNAPRGGERRFDAPAQRSGDYRQERAPAGRNTQHNQSGSYGSYNRQDSAPRGGERRFDTPTPRNSEYSRPATQAPRQVPASTEGVRLNKYLADKQWCSRREADEWIEQGWVSINGKPVTMGQRVQEGDHVHVAAIAHEHQAQLSTIILHKPVGYVSGQAEDGHQPALVLITEENQWQQGGNNQRKTPRSLMGFAPAGRLDIDSTGILILTQDGRMARHIIGENSEIEKEYLVRVSYAAPDNQTISLDVASHFPADQLELLRHGLSLDGQTLKPAQVEWQNPEQLRFVLREGKKRQIRRMCEQVGLHVTGLKRVRIGQLTLGMLPPGQWRYLGEHETI